MGSGPLEVAFSAMEIEGYARYIRYGILGTGIGAIGYGVYLAFGCSS